MSEISHTQARRALLPGASGRLNEAERKALARHLAECVECRLYAGEVDALQYRLRRALHARWDPHALRSSGLPVILAKSRRQTMLRNSIRLAGALVLGVLLLAAAAAALNTLSPRPAGQPAYPSASSQAESYPGEPSLQPPTASPAPAGTPLTRTEVLTYTVRAGDTIFAIAELFELTPETILWGNPETLGESPHSLIPGQVLNILPVNGVYHRWNEGDTLESVADQYEVPAEAILRWPGNRLDPSHPAIAPGTMIVVPGGRREFEEWPSGILIATGTLPTPADR